MKTKSLVLGLLAVSVLAWCGSNTQNQPEAVAEGVTPETYCTNNLWLVENYNDQKVCLFQDESFCELNSFMAWECQPWENFDTAPVWYFDEEAMQACTDEFKPVCWVDGNTYGNKCYLDANHIAEDTNAVVGEDGMCIFG